MWKYNANVHKNYKLMKYLFIALFLSATLLQAQDFKLPLWEDKIPNYKANNEKEQVATDWGIDWITLVEKPTIEVYLPAKNSSTGQAVVICPGGGYVGLAYDWEGTDIAKWLNSKGIAGIVLKNRLPSVNSNMVPHQSPLMDAKRAIRLARHHAKDWNIEDGKIGIMGFSAGGHLAATLGTHFEEDQGGSDVIDQLSCRPDFMALIYPVISTTADFMHKGSRDYLLGKDASQDLIRFYSNELHVGNHTPPTFLMHAGDDMAVPVENSIVFYQALKEKNIPAEMHIYPEGGHGFSLAVGKDYLSTWPDRLADWLKKISTHDPDKEEWQQLFNGKDLNDWDIRLAGRPKNDNYKNTFKIEDNMIRISYDDYEQFDDKYGHMYYKEPFSYYKLKFDYRFVGDQIPGGATWNVRNSGIMFHSQSADSAGDEQHFPVSVEIQLLGGLGTGPRTTANICTPGTLFEIDGKEIEDHCYNSTSKTYDGDQWVQVEALIYGDSAITHIVEGDTVLSYEHPKLDKYFIAEDSALNWESGHVKDYEQYVKRDRQLLKSGYIALQAESHPIDFKNIKLLNLEGCMDKEAKNFKSYYIKSDASKCVY